MSFTAMLRPTYTQVLTVTGIDDGEDDNENEERDVKKEEREEKEAKTALLNHLLLARYGMDMGGRLGLNKSRGKLAEVYLKTVPGKTPQEKAKEAVKKVDAVIQAFSKALDAMRFPNIGAGQAR